MKDIEVINMNEFRKDYEELNHRISQRLKSDIIYSDGDEMSLYEFNQALNNGLFIYNNTFIKDVRKLEREMNRKVFLLNLFSNDFPEIYSILPQVTSDGRYYIQILLKSNSNRYSGSVLINEDNNIDIVLLKNQYSDEKIRKFLNKYSYKFKEYLSLLKVFSHEYPNVNCVWNSNFEENAQHVDDGFLHAVIKAETLNEPLLYLSDKKDLKLSKYESPTNGKLSEFIDCNKNSLMKRMKVNINDFNDLYRAIVKKELGLDKTQTLKRVK